MKVLTSYRPLLVLLLTLLLSACGDDEQKTSDPQPRLSRTLKVVYSGQNLAGLGAHIDVISKSAQGVETPFISEDIPENTITQTKPAFTVPEGNDLTVTIMLTRVPSGQRAPTGTSLEAQLLDGDKVVRSLQLDKTTPSVNGLISAKLAISSTDF